MSTAAQVAAIRDYWPTALKVLKCIPAAVADKSLPLKDLHYMASQAEVDCGRASMYTPDYEVDGRAGFAPQSRKVLVDEFKVPHHMAKAAACLLPVSFTFHMAVEILHDLADLINMLEPGLHFTMRSTDQYSMPGNALTIATQLTASGLLQQLPAVVAQAEQQLQKLEPTGWCGGPCHFCMKGKRSVGRIADFSDPSSAGRHPLPAFLLDFCSNLVSFWPGGALSSTALGPSLVPMAQLALSGLQYTTQQAQKHKPVGSRPPGALPELGRAALDTCLALCAATAAATFSSGGAASNALENRSVSRLPSHSLELLLHPAMLSAAVAVACAAIYGEHVASTAAEPESSTAGDSSSKTSMLTSGYKALDQAGPEAFHNGLADDMVKSVAPLIYLQESVGPDAECSDKV